MKNNSVFSAIGHPVLKLRRPEVIPVCSQLLVFNAMEYEVPLWVVQNLTKILEFGALLTEVNGLLLEITMAAFLGNTTVN